MSKELEDKLSKTARKKGLTGKRKAAYIFGTMRKMGWTPDHDPSQCSECKRRKK